jgi:hypothetical protein
LHVGGKRVCLVVAEDWPPQPVNHGGLPPAGQKNGYTQSTQSCLDVIFLGQIEPEVKKTKWNKISDFLSSLFLVYQFF